MKIVRATSVSRESFPSDKSESSVLAALERSRQRIHALPRVIGTGVGLRNSEPIVEIFIAGTGNAELEQAIRDIIGNDFILVPNSEPAEGGVCPQCGSGVLSHGEHIRDDLAPCFGGKPTEEEKQHQENLLDDDKRGGALHRWPKSTPLLCRVGLHWRNRDDSGGPFQSVRWVCRCGSSVVFADDYAGY